MSQGVSIGRLSRLPKHSLEDISEIVALHTELLLYIVSRMRYTQSTILIFKLMGTFDYWLIHGKLEQR